MKAREPRQKVMLKARLRIGAAWRDACILDLSSRGMMIQAKDPLPGGSYLELRRGRHVIVARVMWSSGQRCGLRTQDALPCEAIIAEQDKTGGPGPPQWERRAARAPAPRAFDHERSRWRSRSLEFIGVILVGGACGSLAHSAVSETLARPLLAVERVLGGK